MKPYLRAANVTWDGLTLDDVKEMHFSPNELATFRLAPGDILLSEASGSASEVGKPALWRGEIEDCCFQNTLLRVRTGHLEPTYLLWYFKWLALSGQFGRGSRGVGIHHLGAKALNQWKIPVAPLGEQKRIVAAIEEQFSRVDSGWAALERVRKGLKRMRTTLLLRAFENIARTSEAMSGREVFSFITSGSRGWAKFYSNEGPTFLRIGNLPRLGIDLDLSEIQHVQAPSNTEGARTRLRPGDIVISITADLGRVAVIPTSLGEAFINQHVALARPGSGLEPRYVAWYLSSPFGLRQWESLRRGATKVGLGLSDIRAVRVPIPDLSTQRATVSRIEQAWTILDAIGQTVVEATRRSQSLRSSILAAAFSGRLVSHEPEDEPASVLLERIASERATANGQRRSTKASRQARTTT